MSIPYTFKERTEKRFTKQQAVDAAFARYKKPVCADMCKQFPDMLTTVEFNKLVDAIVDDSMYYDGAWIVSNHHDHY